MSSKTAVHSSNRFELIFLKKYGLLHKNKQGIYGIAKAVKSIHDMESDRQYNTITDGVGADPLNSFSLDQENAVYSCESLL